MRYTVDTFNKTITLENGSWEIEAFVESIAELSKTFSGYSIQIIEKIQLIEKPQQIGQPYPWTPSSPFPNQPNFIYCSSAENIK